MLIIFFRVKETITAKRKLCFQNISTIKVVNRKEHLFSNSVQEVSGHVYAIHFKLNFKLLIATYKIFLAKLKGKYSYSTFKFMTKSMNK